MTRKAIQAAVAVMLLLTLSTALLAQRNRDKDRGGRWIYLGEANVDGRADHDKISVGKSEGRFRELQIRVERAPIEFQRVVVHYSDGGDEELPVRERIRAGSETRPLDLRGRERNINSVEFWYARARSNSEKPKLRLYGR